LSTSAFNLGTAVGSWMAGRALESPLRELGPPIIGTTVATLTLIPLAALALKHRGHALAAVEPDRAGAQGEVVPGGVPVSTS
jgi:DHA1 family inner membrane transport protein